MSATLSGTSVRLGVLPLVPTENSKTNNGAEPVTDDERQFDEEPSCWMVRWNRQPRYDEMKYFEKEREAAAFKHELQENGWTDPELVPLYARKYK
jgi:hypothetical protein